MRRPLIMIGVTSALIFGLSMLPLDTEKNREVAVQLDPVLWADYRDRFIEQGRVIDNYQGSVSHSEGQGYGMLMAEAAGDRDNFERLWEWTRTVMQREDGLFSWRYEHCTRRDDSCITDVNNASDGDILISWALLRAYHRWHDESYYHHARRIAATVAGELLVRDKGRVFILPGRKGFSNGHKLTINTSYWVFPALESFSREFDQQLWDEVIASGKWLVQQARFGAYQLPADWVELENGAVKPSEKYPPRYSYDAVRIPLHQAWSEAGITRADLAPYQRYWSRSKSPPAWINLNNDTESSFSWSTGMAAIAALARHRANGKTGAPKLPRPDKNDGYYSWSLTLLTHIAATETAR